jgi:ketosteroid isomerase-like protein
MKIAVKPSDIAACVAEYLQAGDLEGVVSMFHPDCQIYFPPGEAPSVGLDGARAVFKDFVPMRPVLKSTVTNEVINGDTALLKADWSFEDADGNVIAQGQSTEVAKKLANGGWGYLIDCPNGPPVA